MGDNIADFVLVLKTRYALLRNQIWRLFIYCAVCNFVAPDNSFSFYSLFLVNVSILYPLKTPENLDFLLLCWSINGKIGQKWVNR